MTNDHPLPTPAVDTELQAFTAAVEGAPCRATRACDQQVATFLGWTEEASDPTAPLIIVEPTCAAHHQKTRRLVSAMRGRIRWEVKRYDLAARLAVEHSRGLSLVMPPPHGTTQGAEVSLRGAGPPPPAPFAVARRRIPLPWQREYIARRLTPLLPTGTVVRQVFGAQRYPPWLIGPLRLLDLLFAFIFGWRVVAVTDQGIYVFKATFWLTWRPKRLVHRLPRQTRLGPVAGIFPRIRIGPEWVWVNWRFFEDIRDADRELDIALHERG